MTNRINALTVVLETDMREDDIQALINAILMLRNVLSVDTNIADINSHLAEMRAKYELRKQLFEIFEKK